MFNAFSKEDFKAMESGCLTTAVLALLGAATVVGAAVLGIVWLFRHIRVVLA